MNEQFLKYLKHFDPCLMLSLQNDLYDEVVSKVLVTVQDTDDVGQAMFLEILAAALSEVYTPGWLQNKNISWPGFGKIIYNELFDRGDVRETSEESVWINGSSIMFEFWESQTDYAGSIAYSDSAHDLIYTHSVEPEEQQFKVLHLGDILGVMIDSYGRVQSPVHRLNNLYLDSKKSENLQFPENAHGGEAYLLNPRSVMDSSDPAYLTMPALEDIRFDSASKVLEIGSIEDGLKIKIASGFVISIRDNAITGASLRLS